jgi:hypothetical protein
MQERKELDDLKLNCLKKEMKKLLILVQKNWILGTDLIFALLVVSLTEDFIIIYSDLVGILLMKKKLFT